MTRKVPHQAVCASSRHHVVERHHRPTSCIWARVLQIPRHPRVKPTAVRFKSGALEASVVAGLIVVGLGLS